MITYTSRKTDSYARVAQLVERDLAKVEAAGSSPVSRSWGKPGNIEITMFSDFLLCINLRLSCVYALFMRFFELLGFYFVKYKSSALKLSATFGRFDNVLDIIPGLPDITVS